MHQDERPVSINISAIPVEGVGGLGLVAIAVLVSIVMPAARWAMTAGLAGGLLLAVALVAFRRHRKSTGPSGDDPAILFRDVPSRRECRDTDSADRAITRFLDQPITRSPDHPIYSTL